jgi:beta-exotoxin I transport system permease protein
MSHTITMLDLRLRRRAVIGYSIGLALYTLAIVALYPSFKNDASLNKLVESDPTMMAAFGISGSLTSPEGWMNGNIYNNFLPLILVILTIGYGAWCIAGQDESGSLALLASLPTTRRNLVLQKAVALVLQTLPAVLATYVFVVVGIGFQVHLGAAATIEATLASLLLAVDFGALALFLGIVTGSRGVALGISSAVAATAYLISSLAPSIGWLHPARFVSPFYWATGNNPLQNGLAAGPALALVGLAVVLVCAAAVSIERMDLH